MAKAIYDVQVPNIGEVERALGDLHDKAPRAMKNAVNQTATRAKNMMVRQARLRYAVNSAGRRHLNALKIRNRATTQNPTAEIFISSRRNDLGDFQSNPAVPHMGTSWVLSPEFHTSRVLKKNLMAPLTGGQTDYGQASKGFLVKFDSGHVGMVQRILGRPATNPKSTRWRNRNGIVEKLYTMSSPSASAMHSTVWREEVEPDSEIILQERLRHEVSKILLQAGRKAK